MRILYLSYDGMTDPLGQSQVIPYLKGLSKKGCDITLISFEKQDQKASKSTISRLLSESAIEWIPLEYTKKPPVISTLRDLVKLNSTVKNLINKHNTDKLIIHCRSYLTALIGLKYKRKNDSRFIFDMRGFWADERVEGNIWSLKNPIFKIIYKFFKKKEAQFFKEADHTVSLTHKGAEEIKKLYGQNKIAPITIIPCCVDNNHFDPSSFSSDNSKMVLEKLHLQKSNFVLGYVGSIGTWYMLTEMMSFYKKLLLTKPESVFLFVTKENPEIIQREAQSQEVPLENIRIVSAKRNEVPEYINIFSWSIFFIKPVFSKQASSPTKQGEIMSMGIPIICNDRVGDTEKIINDYDAGIVISEFNSESYINAIDSMDDMTVNHELIQKGSKEYFSLINGIEKYDLIYQSLS